MAFEMERNGRYASLPDNRRTELRRGALRSLHDFDKTYHLLFSCGRGLLNASMAITEARKGQQARKAPLRQAGDTEEFMEVSRLNHFQSDFSRRQLPARTDEHNPDEIVVCKPIADRHGRRISVTSHPSNARDAARSAVNRWERPPSFRFGKTISICLFVQTRALSDNRDVAKITCCLHWSSPLSGGDQSFVRRGMVSSLRRLELGPRPISSPA